MEMDKSKSWVHSETWREIRMERDTSVMEEGGREIKIAERRESRQRLFPQDVVNTATKRQERQHHYPLVALTPA